jgi:hypothetical protein
MFREAYAGSDSLFGHFPLLNKQMDDPNPSFYALKQMTTALTDKRFNGRVMTGDSVTDPLVRMYEFEDPATLKRTWVCWRNGDVGGQDVPAHLPVRADSLKLTSLDYTGSPPTVVYAAGHDGWLDLGAATRPTFVWESTAISRPELVVDSFEVEPETLHVGHSATFTARIKNDGRTTPDPVHVGFRRNDSLYVTSQTDSAIDNGQTRTVILVTEAVPSWMHGTGLFRAEANPGQQYVEKTGTDDNSGYKRVLVRWQPWGILDAVMPPNHMTNEPLVLFKLGSRSWEADTLDSIPCDSAMLIQKYYGLRDSIVHNTDTMGWFAFRPETSWTFLHGAGKYEFFLVVKDSWSTSDAISDTSDSIVVFDTVAAAGSISLNNGARFARTVSCTLGIAVADSGAGLRAMRLGTRLSNFLSNSGCAATDGAWTLSGGAYDSALVHDPA